MGTIPRIGRQKIMVACDGKVVGHRDGIANWSFVAFDERGQLVIERQGHHQPKNSMTDDEAEFIAVKAGVLWAALEHPVGEIEVATKSAKVADWLRNRGTPQYSEIYRELYEFGARTGEYSVIVVPEKNARPMTYRGQSRR